MDTVLTYYFVVAFAAFGMWFTQFWNDPTTPLNDRISWIILFLAPLCWPITIPTSILKLTTMRTRSRVTMEKSISIKPASLATMSSKTEIDDQI
ncbi:hypothetical protein [Limnoraphis robusta]|uniref:Uncharacterized protein n=1 Tax=Limnoraphis robusta CCNP1315 TaxID=3110306 RepID=A0ABU5TXR2_9CYAN|nr:hypothetical protein [Limnoraphis robusta]MEA5519737.1 hypothetical protein [Limnoraphis robusta CCNP1315]MEA5544307.1 hypothetical protein [Limnoraphis robusta CCNP1324]